MVAVGETSAVTGGEGAAVGGGVDAFLAVEHSAPGTNVCDLVSVGAVEVGATAERRVAVIAVGTPGASVGTGVSCRGDAPTSVEYAAPGADETGAVTGAAVVVPTAVVGVAV